MERRNLQRPQPTPELVRRLRTPEAAAFLGVSKSFMEKCRLTGNGPAYAKLGRVVVYDPSDLDTWANTRKRSSTSE
jgi:predicted DNA-binding transcriptional regulator AlpA